jgi:hypothetical protein
MVIAIITKEQVFKETAVYKNYMIETGVGKAKCFLPSIHGAWTVWSMECTSLQQRCITPYLIEETATPFGTKVIGER